VKGDDLTHDTEVSIKLIDLAAQFGETVCDANGIARVFGLEKAVERSLNKGRLCRPTALGRGGQSRRRTLGKIDANPRFHLSALPNKRSRCGALAERSRLACCKCF
jgi:hypothetical protein